MVVSPSKRSDRAVECVQLRSSGVGTKRIDDLAKLESSYKRKRGEAWMVVLGRGGASRVWARW